MGLLDDAIREHLELKRKHGADPEDVARQEQEALGPGRRNEFAQPEEEPAAAVAPEPEPPLQEEPPAPEPAPAEPPAGQEEDPWLPDDDERDEVPAEESLQPPAPRGEDDDVLDQTPDFLQETPEHDRLWFEQKPPRDFDWDK
jgi:hypothetical protein